jgi:hypothetical protein
MITADGSAASILQRMKDWQRTIGAHG